MFTNNKMDNSFVFVDANPNILNNATTEMQVDVHPLKIKSMHVVSNIRNRYARTVVTSKYLNKETVAQEATFSLVLPDTAFIAGFVMEIKGKKYEAYVKEKAEAKQEYDAAVSRGLGAAHVAVSARDSNKFTVSANVEPQSDVTFILTYEELLVRKHGRYEIVINLHPTQYIDDFQVDVHINETRPIVNIETPALRSGNEITTEVTKNKFTTIKTENDKLIHVGFHPTVEQQKEMANNTISDDGISGQFVVQYDVERDPLGGEVLVNDGYFVHFFSPSKLEPIPKLVVFVLDVSGSMHGRKIQQLQEAMNSILGELNPEDNFNIVKFSNDVQILYSNSSMQENANTSLPATKENIEKAQKVVMSMSAGGGTNICDALITALSLTLKGVAVSGENVNKHKPQPMIVFLTDGQANVGQSQPAKIIEIVAQRNDSENKAAIFTLAFGNDANKDFLKELAMKNSGFLRNIYEAADASLQLQDFYKQISSPLLTNVNFKYSEEVKETTKNKFDILFNGSEFVVTGKVDKVLDGFVVVEGSTLYGINDFCPTIIPICPTKEEKEKYGSLERLWAYMTIKQLLDKKYEKKTNDNPVDLETPEKKALKLALTYSFVTPVTSLVVVKPENTDENDLQWGSVSVASPVDSMRRFRLIGGGGPGFLQQNMRSNSNSTRGALFGCSTNQQQSQFSCPTFGFATSQSQNSMGALFGSSTNQQQQSSASFSCAPRKKSLESMGGSSSSTINLKNKNILPFFTEIWDLSEKPDNKAGSSFGSSSSPLPPSALFSSGPSSEIQVGNLTSFHSSSRSSPPRERMNKIPKQKPVPIIIPQPPQLTSMQIVTNVQNLQSHTVIRTKYANQESRALQTSFAIVLPDSALITGFSMIVNGTNYKGCKQEVTQVTAEEYYVAKELNMTAGYLANKPENPNTFIGTVNIEAHSEATFILTYEERLTKKDEKYEIITNLIPRVKIENLEIDITINGTKPITNMDSPVIKSKVGVIKCQSAVVNKINDGSVHINFKPTIAQQDVIVNVLKEVENNDISRQFVVEFTTEADLDDAGKVVNDPLGVQSQVNYIVVKSDKFTT